MDKLNLKANTSHQIVKGNGHTQKKMKRGAKSVIDFVLVEERNNYKIKDMIIDEEGNSKIESDHNTIQFKWEIEKEAIRKLEQIRVQNNREKEKNWKKGDPESWEKYKKKLDRKLIARETETQGNWDQTKIDAEYDEIIKDLKESWESTVGGKQSRVEKKTSKGKQKKGWWDTELKEIYKEKKEANREWRRSIARKEIVGEEIVNTNWEKLAELKVKWKNQIRKKKMIYNKKKYEEVTDKINNTKVMWDHINQIRETREGERENGYLRSGEEVLKGDREILAHIEEVWEKDYKKEEGGQEQIEVGRTLGKEKRESHEITYKIEQKELKNSLKKLKEGKAGGKDRVINEMLTKGGEKLELTLLKYFNVLLETGKTPSKWKTGVVTLLFKTGDKQDINNYRGICVGSTV